MALQALIYETAVPVTAARHGNWSLDLVNDFSASKKVNSVPLMAVEFPNAASEYAIVFSGTKEAVIPSVILGMRADENLYFAETGGWQAKYVPAFVRRYPFVFSISEDEKTFTLCIDESFAHFNQDGRGERLFTDDQDQKPTPYLERVLKFLEQYQIEFRRTQAFCNKLLELDLLEPMRAQAELGSGEKLSLGGFMAVNRDKAKALPAEKLAELAQTDELELLYLHLHSMRNFPAMAGRLAGKAAPANEAGSTAKPQAQPATQPAQAQATPPQSAAKKKKNDEASEKH
jgi:hypothetical protein